MEFNPSVITAAGQALIAEAIAGNLNIIFTKIETGDGTHAASEDLTQITELVSPKQEFPLTSKEVLNQNTVHLKYIVSNVNPDETPLTQGYYVKELALYAKSDQAGATEVLYAVTTAIEGKADWLPPYNELQPSTITMDWYTAVGNASTVSIQDGASAYALADDLGQKDDLQTENKGNLVEAVNEVVGNIGSLNALSTEARDSLVAAINNLVLLVSDAINRTFYEGRDLTVVFADEIAQYSDEWAWIQARLNAHKVPDLRVGDYIPITIAASGSTPAETHKAEIAGINTYYKTGDDGNVVGYHIDWITRDCYSQTVQYNTTNVNNGNSTNSSPFMVSNLKSWLDNTLYPLLPTKVKNVIKGKRILAPYRYTSGSTLTDDNSWGWETFAKLWVPFEFEIFDQLVWSTKGYGNGQAIQYPIYANSYAHRIKGAGPGGGRCNWWTGSVESGNSTYAVYVNTYGYSINWNASIAYRVPVCFRTMEDAA